MAIFSSISSSISGALSNQSGGGIADNCSDSFIRQCALGAFKPFKRGPHLDQRIAGMVAGSSKLENNVALDSHAGESDTNGLDGKSLSAALFTQHYFEHGLGWDFTNVWQWNDAKNRPELRVVGVNAAQQQQRFTEPQGDMGDLLQQQLKANLWL